MASAQVLPSSVSSSRKQGHLEAGKRRLEEFRKKKAEGRTKKAASTGQLQSTDVGQNEKQPESELLRLLDSDGAATSERDGVFSKEPLGIVSVSGAKAIDSSSTTELGSFNGTHGSPPVKTNNHNAFFADPVQKPTKDQESRWYDGSGLLRPLNNHDRWEAEKNHYLGTYAGTRGALAYGVTMDQSIAPNSIRGTGDIDNSVHQFSDHSIGEAQLKEDDSYLKEYSIKYPSTSDVSVTRISPDKPASVPVQSGIGFASTSAVGNVSSLYKDSIHSATNLTDSVPDVEQYMHAGVDYNGDMGGSKVISSTDGPTWKSSESTSTAFNIDLKSSPNGAPLYSEISESGTRRTRPSFLDSLNFPRVSSESHLAFTHQPFMSKSAKVHSNEVLASSASQEPFPENVSFGPFDKLRAPNLQSVHEYSINSSVSASNQGKLLSQRVNNNTMEREHGLLPPKQNEDFAALEQYIEDLTQEKFSLQRALDASRALAESLAAENSSFTDSYNQQGVIVNQLKSDMERLQEEIRAQLLELESLKMEYSNAQLECNAADERAKILASEVIGLEEKALKLRSSELKLERQLENSNAEITSYKKKVSSLEKERQDLQFTIDALQEEKKLLQSKLRKASASGKSTEVIRISSVTKDMSTSTDDLGDEVSNLVHGENTDVDRMPNTFNHEMQDVASFPSSNSSIFPLLPENTQFHLPVASAAIPPDQLRVVGNINSLISELALEKEELIQALASESSHSSKLEELNKELSGKLEAQTQRLELLTAQSMANENIPAKPTDSRPVHDGSAYTDEGDEVVERVLGWIMKLFPGGPSKRRTSKLL